MVLTKRDSKNYLHLALYAFAGFGVEILLIMLEQFIYKIPSVQWSSIQHIFHLILTSIMWGGISFLLIRNSAKENNFDILKMNKKPNLKGLMIVIVIAVICIIITTLVWGGLKPVKEFYSRGIGIWIFQNIYYLFEAGLIVLTITFGQKYGVEKLEKSNIPWGGIVLGVTWGLVHILTQGLATGIYALAMSIFYGIIYLLLKQNTKLTYLIIALIFIL